VPASVYLHYWLLNTQRVRSRGGNAERLKSLGVSSSRTQIRHIGAKFWCEVARSSETRKLSGKQFLKFKTQFSRNWWTLVHIFWRCWKALPKDYKPPKFSGPKFRNKKVTGWAIFELWTQCFSKLVNFGPHISTLLESPREGLQATKILWAKVQKQKKYVGSNSDKNSDFLKIGELWSTYFDVFG